MSDVEVFPPDVMAAAAEGVRSYHQPRYDPGLQTCFARAIMVERRRCLRIAHLYAEGLPDSGEEGTIKRFVNDAIVDLANTIAASIEAGE